MQYKHEPLDSHLSLILLNSVHDKKDMVKWAKKEIWKIMILVLNQSPISAVFTIVRFAGDPKTALTGDLLYHTTKVMLPGNQTVCNQIFLIDLDMQP